MMRAFGPLARLLALSRSAPPREVGRGRTFFPPFRCTSMTASLRPSGPMLDQHPGPAPGCGVAQHYVEPAEGVEGLPAPCAHPAARELGDVVSRCDRLPPALRISPTTAPPRPGPNRTPPVPVRASRRGPSPRPGAPLPPRQHNAFSRRSRGPPPPCTITTTSRPARASPWRSPRSGSRADAMDDRPPVASCRRRPFFSAWCAAG